MDAIVGLLAGIRARGTLLLRVVMDPPWAMRIEDEAPLTLVAVVRGHAWIAPAGDTPRRLTAGGVAIVRGPDHYIVADDLANTPSVVIHPGQRCTTLNDEDLALEMSLGLRTWGNNHNGATVMLVGTYEGHSEISKRLLDALPALISLGVDEWDSTLVRLLTADITRDDPGQELVLDRILDLIVVAVVRAWFSRAGDDAPAWWRADDDAAIGTSMRLIYNRPAEPWTIARLASAVGLSRAAFARRFHELVGEPPIAFLTSWRLALAADLLRESESTVAAVASKVGYASPYAFSTAFKRAHGVSPRQHALTSRTAD